MQPPRDEGLSSGNLPTLLASCPLVTDTSPSAPATSHRPGGVRELLTLALPLIVSAGFLTIQLCLDRIFLTWTGNDEAAASMPASSSSAITSTSPAPRPANG